MPQLLDPAYRLRCEQYITADSTNLCRYVINHDNPISLAHSMHNFALLILTWAAIDTTFHFTLSMLRLSFIISGYMHKWPINRPLQPMPD